MKRIIGILLLVFLISSCSSTRNSNSSTPIQSTAAPGNTSQAAEVKYLPQPKITVSTLQNYKYDSWVDQDAIEVKNNESLTLRGNGFSILIQFDPSTDIKDIKNHIMVGGYGDVKWSNEIGVVANDRCFYGCLNKCEFGKEYILYIDNNIKDSEGNKLKDAVVQKYSLRDTVKAYYTFKGDYFNYSGLGVSYNFKDETGITLPVLCITPGLKEFTIDFSDDVDKKSVEESINNGLKDESVLYKWISDRRVKINIDIKKSDYHIISMKSAQDKSGGNIIGSLDFTAGKPSKICQYDFEKNKEEVLKQFNSTRIAQIQKLSYTDYFEGFVGNYINTSDKVKDYYYRLSDGKLIILGNEAYCIKDYIDQDTMLYLDIKYDESSHDINSKSIIRYDIKSGKRTKLFEIPGKTNDEVSLSISPQGDKIAVVSRKNDILYIKVYDMKGKVLFIRNGVKPYTSSDNKLGIYNDRVSWLDEDNIIYENKELNPNKCDIEKAALSTSKTEVYLKNAYQPITYPEKKLAAVKLFKKTSGENSSTIGIYTDGRNTDEFSDEGKNLSNFVFAKDGSLIMNTRDYKIYSYNTSAKKLQYAADGCIKGISWDRSRIYYIKDFELIIPEY